jgi:hypothetical protein
MEKKSSKVAGITQRMSRNLLGLRRDLVALGRALQAVAAAQRTLSRRVGRGAAGAVARPGRRERQLTAADRARLKVQGEYLGLVRHLTARNRARVKAMKAEKGYGAALKLARQLGQGRS